MSTNAAFKRKTSHVGALAFHANECLAGPGALGDGSQEEPDLDEAGDVDDRTVFRERMLWQGRYEPRERSARGPLLASRCEASVMGSLRCLFVRRRHFRCDYTVADRAAVACRARC